MGVNEKEKIVPKNNSRKTYPNFGAFICCLSAPLIC